MPKLYKKRNEDQIKRLRNVVDQRMMYLRIPPPTKKSLVAKDLAKIKS